MSDQPAPLDSHLGFWLRLVSNRVSFRFQKLLEEQGVTVAEWVALRTLWQQPQTSYAQLIEALGMTKGAVSKVMQKLEEKGYASRQLAAGKAREQLLTLTESGRQLVPLLCDLADANDALFFAHLPPAEREALQQTLKGLVSYHQMQGLPVS